MTDQNDLSITKRCKQCGRRFPLETMQQVSTAWGANRFVQWQVMCSYCAKSYVDYMAALGANGAKVPEVTLHGV